MSEWRPYITAPKDGRRIRVMRENCTPQGYASWSDGEQRWITNVLFIGREGCNAAFTHWKPWDGETFPYPNGSTPEQLAPKPADAE